MNDSLFGIPDLDIYLVAGILVLFGIIEIAAGYLQRTQRKLGDWIQEFGGFLVLSQLIKPGILLAVIGLGHAFLPSWEHLFQDWAWWIMLPAFLLVDDLLQYWYHRLAHERPFLWKLHRAHHQAEEMGFFVSYRNAGLYYLMMPNIWWMSLFTFMGGGIGVAMGLVLKQLVIIGSHSTVKWDAPLYRSKWGLPIVQFLERILITPAFHHAHHGRSQVDGISDPNGNFGNMFSIWDQLFGTAMYTHQFPEEYGLQTQTEDHWSAAYFYPAVASKDENSVLARSYTNDSTATPDPIWVELKEGEAYLWCQCGHTKTAPFCDGSHHGTGQKPLRFVAAKTGKKRLCNCKLTAHGPFCDNSHVRWDRDKTHRG
ncbi:MAG: sterol desaturase family protein [Bacteroidota bacterium]